MTTYYLEFKTWMEGSVELPGKFRTIGEINDWRNKSNPTTPINPNYVQNIFGSLNEQTIEKFITDYIPALIIGLIIDIDDPNQIVPKLEQLLGPIELLGIVAVTAENYNNIDKIMGDA